MNSKKNSCRGNYMRKYGIYIFDFLWVKIGCHLHFNTANNTESAFIDSLYIGRTWVSLFQKIDLVISKFLRIPCLLPQISEVFQKNFFSKIKYFFLILCPHILEIEYVHTFWQKNPM